MQRFFSVQKAYYVPVFTYLFLGTITLFFIEKGETVIFFSENRTPFWNQFFLTANEFGEEYTYLIGFLLLLLFVNIKQALFIPILGGLVTLFSLLLKTLFAHPRPKIWLETQDIMIQYVPDIYINVGYTSFPSGHTFSAYAIMGYLALISRYHWLKITFVILAILGGLARVYLSQHFLEDTIFGGFLGTLLAIGMYQLQEKIRIKKPWGRTSIYKLMQP